MSRRPTKRSRVEGVDLPESIFAPKPKRRPRRLRTGIVELGQVGETSYPTVLPIGAGDAPYETTSAVRQREPSNQPGRTQSQNITSTSSVVSSSRNAAPQASQLEPTQPTVPAGDSPVRRHIGLLRHAPTERRVMSSDSSYDTDWNSLPMARVVGARISLMSSEEIRREGGSREITNGSLSDAPDCIHDKRMGPTSLTTKCDTCSTYGCAGHFGIIDLKRPHFNPLHLKSLLMVLKCICSSCGRLLMKPREIVSKRLTSYHCEKRLRLMSKLSVGKSCTWNKDNPCDDNPKYIVKDSKTFGEIACIQNGKVFSLSVQTIKDRLNAISKSDAEYMGFACGNHPVDLLVDVVPVLPNNCKAPYYDGVYQRHTHIANQLKELVKQVSSEQHGRVYHTLSTMVCKSPANSVENSDQATVMDQLQGKSALIRGNALGKPGNQHMRSVSGPDSALEFGQVRIPREFMMLNTKPLIVTARNMDVAKRLCRMGLVMHFIEPGQSIRKRVFRNYSPVVGHTIHRCMLNGDTVLVNRQPTLHKGSVFGVEVLLGTQRTIGLHMALTTPMNADFDGDENNIYNLHMMMATAEARMLQSPKMNFMSVSSSAPMYGLVINGVTSAYMMSRNNYPVAAKLMTLIIKLLVSDKQNRWDRVKAKMLAMKLDPMTTRGILSLLYPENFFYCRDGVHIVEGIHVCGSLTKATVGNKSHSILHEIYNAYGPDRAAVFLTEATMITDEWLCQVGFSIDLTDFLCVEYGVNNTLINPYEDMMEKVYFDMRAKLVELNNNKTMNKRIKEMEITSTLNITNQLGLTLAKKYQTPDNPIHIMGELGANTKGDVMKNCQMMCTVAQQYLSGEPIPAKLSNNTRLLPCMDINDPDPVAKGYVKESYFKGVNGAGMFFIHQAGREGILNTSVQTAKYGEMHRRMVRGYCGVVLDSDYSLRMGMNRVLSPVFNLGFSIESNVPVKVDGERVMASVDVFQLALQINGARGWVKKEVSKTLDSRPGKADVDISSLQVPCVSPLDQNELEGEFIPHVITSFEKAKLVGFRAEQLQYDMPPLLDEKTLPKWDGIDPVSVAMREMQDGLFTMKVMRVLPSGRKLILDPKDNLAFKVVHPEERWMREYRTIKFNRTLPTIIEDKVSNEAPQKMTVLPKNIKSRIAEFAQTEGMEVEAMTDIVSQGGAAETKADMPPRTKRRKVEETKDEPLPVDAAVHSMTTEEHGGEIVTIVSPEKTSFLDADTFYRQVPQDTPENSTTVMLKVRKANNLAKRSLIAKALAMFTGPIVVFDACCGRGGDLLKWGTKVDSLYGIDMSKTLLEEMKKRYESIRDRAPKEVNTFEWDMRREMVVDMPKADIASCMFALNYMDQRKEEVTRCLSNICKNLKDKAVVIMIYTNPLTVRSYVNTKDCTVTPLTPGNWTTGYNFRLGSLVDAVEFQVLPQTVDAVMSAFGFRRHINQSLLNTCSSMMDWTDPASSSPVTAAMLISNLYISEMWVR